jgi:protoheme IX farnesyltransferase
MFTITSYYQLVKPGMIYGNAVVMTGGFLLASRGQIDLGLFAATLIGMSLIIASGCVFNNYIDRDIDVLMERTRDRVSARGLISAEKMIVYGVSLGLLGVLILLLFTHVLTCIIALFGFFAYVFLYTLWTKRHSVHSTTVGSLAGATPPVIGYCAVTGRIDIVASILFLIMVLWQMPHFYAIGIRRLEDYTAASLPIMPVIHGIRTTKILMTIYIALFGMMTALLAILGYMGHVYFVVMTILAALWLGFGIKGFWTTNDHRWAHIMFILSLVIILSFGLLIAWDVII